MSQWRPNLDVLLTDSEDEEDELTKRDYRGREAMIFVVDAHLFKEPERFANALEIIKLAFISGMLANHKDLLAVVFTNTELSPEPLDATLIDHIVIPKNCAVFLPLLQLTQPIVEYYLRFLTIAQQEFPTKFGFSTENGSFANTMRLCMDLFETAGYALNISQLVYLTDQETPHVLKSHAFNMAMRRATDLEAREIEFYVIPMVDKFNYEAFYKEFLTLVRSVELDSFIEPDPQQLREMLANHKLRQDFLKRTLGHFRFTLGPNLQLAAQYYNYFRRRMYPRKVCLLRKNNSIVTPKQTITVRKLETNDNDVTECTEERVIKTTEGWYEINVGDMPIRISPQQMDRIRNLHSPGMMLLGFKPLSSLPHNLYYLPVNFMYPDDQSIRGSKRLFRALWEACHNRQKIAICIFMRKKKSIPRYVALVPVQAADKSEHSATSLLRGDGFKIIYLPMAKHIRNLNLKDWCPVQDTAGDQGSAVFEKVIRKLRIVYQPNCINEPALERLQSQLLALSLNIRTENDGQTAMPDAKMQDQRIAKLLPQIEEIFGNELVVAPAKKRPLASQGEDNNRSKIAKITDENIQSYDQVEEMIANKTIKNCTVNQLRFILKEHFGVTMPSTSRKENYIERINQLSVSSS